MTYKPLRNPEHKIVTIVGAAATTRDKVDWDVKNCEYWTLNEFATGRFDFIKHCDRLFQVHPKWSYSRATNHNDPDYWAWLQKDREYPVYLIEPDAEVPNSLVYPVQAVCDFFGMTPDKLQPPKAEVLTASQKFYTTSTLPFMIALALLEGFTEIRILGFEMGSATEYAHQKGSAEFWLGIAWATPGVTVKMPTSSLLLGNNARQYGIEYDVEVSRQYFEIRQNDLEQLRDQQLALANSYVGEVRIHTKAMRAHQTKLEGMQKLFVAAQSNKRRQTVDQQIQAYVNEHTGPLNMLIGETNAKAQQHLTQATAYNLGAGEMKNIVRMIDDQRPPPPSPKLADSDVDVSNLFPEIKQTRLDLGQLPQGKQPTK